MSLKDSFEGKRVLVTGAGRGIGRGVAKRLYEYGATVYALARTQAHLDTLKEECPDINIVCVDLEDWVVAREAVKMIGPVDHLVNNAAILVGENFMDITPEVFDKMMAVNVRAPINVGQVVARGMMDEGIKGSIVNMSSDASTTPFPATTVYCLTKAAIDMLTKAMAVELGPHKIRVNSINPAGIATDMLTGFYESIALKEGKSVEELKSDINSRVPLGTYEMDISEIVNAILFLLSNLCPLISGESLFIDGALRHT